MKTNKNRTISKKIIILFMTCAIVLNYVLPITTVFALASYTITFVAQGTHTMNMDENHLMIDGNVVELRNSSNASVGTASCNTGNTQCQISGITEASKLNYGGNNFTLYNTNGHTKVSLETEFTSNQVLNVEDYSDGGGQQGGGSNTNNPQENSSATINYSVNGVVEYDADPFDGLGISFRINGTTYRPDTNKMNYTEDTAYERDEHGQIIMGNNNQPIPVLDPDTNEPMREKTGVTVNGDTIYYDSNEDKVNFVFIMNPGTLMTGLIINGQTINDLPDTSEELMAHYTDHRIEIEVNNINKDDTYNIQITGRYPNSDEEFMGNFLWDYNPEGYTGPDDKILNGKLELVKAEYNGHTYTTPEEINALGGVYIWNNAIRKQNYTDEREGCGEAQFPKGTILTVKIIPDAGYQLIDFGINGGVFEPQEEIGTYSFVVNGGPFHLQANIQQVEDEVKTSSEKVNAGAINLGEEESMSVGTARLDVKDIQLTQEQKNNFKEAADGYKVKSYLDISLYNTVYKGTSTSSWDTQVNNLENEAEVFLQLEENAKGEDIVIVHEKHDGTYEIIPTEYLKDYNAIVFKTKSFSNYAIASKPANTTSFMNNPLTGDKILLYISMLGLSLIALTGTVLYTRKKYVNK